MTALIFPAPPHLCGAVQHPAPVAVPAAAPHVPPDVTLNVAPNITPDVARSRRGQRTKVAAVGAARLRPRILPIFLPFAGCPSRCVFCAQDVQTGRRGGSACVADALALAEARLQAEAQHTDAIGDGKHGSHAPLELAFYGGTFTLLPEAERDACLAFAQRWRQRGVVCRVRCSTRPDAVTDAMLAELRDRGVDCVELGVQSFDDAALAAAGRGYSGGVARAACAGVAAAGLELGVQLMPGMPGVTPQVFRADVCEALRPLPGNAAPAHREEPGQPASAPALADRSAASFLRFYPCLVLRGTALAEHWRQGRYAPWTLEATVDALADGLLAAWACAVPVVRMGLSPEDGLEEAVLAGPTHPALGQLVKAEALRRHIAGWVAQLGRAPTRLVVPRSLRGLFWGHANGLMAAYARMGITPALVSWHDDAHFLLE